MPRCPRCAEGERCSQHRKCPAGCTCKRHRTWRELRPETPVSYIARHMRVYRERGRASEYDCVQCSGHAREWALIKGADGTEPQTDYQPMCSSCHKRYDDIGERSAQKRRGRKTSAETRAKMSASMKARPPRSKEHNEKLAATHRGKKRPPEAIENMRKAQQLRYAKEREARAQSLPE